MAHSPVFRPDPFEPREPSRAQEPRSAREDGSPAGPSLSQCLSALEACGGGSVSAEVALDLVLNEVVERACLATSATAGAIALARDGEMVCRATTGENAPDLGVRFDTAQGLSGACVRTREGQRCNDTENDSRVNAGVCRQLGVRSILVVPVQRGEELIGVIEIFSVRTNAFSDRDVRCLQAFSLEVVENVERAVGAQVPQPPPAAVEPPPLAGFPEPPSSKPVLSAPEVPSPNQEVAPRKDFSTTALLVCVVLLALIVGWMVGRSEWPRTNSRPGVPAKQVVQGQSAVSPSDSSPIVSPEPPAGTQSQTSSANSKLTAADNAVDDALVITRDGKVVFRTPPHPVDDSANGTNQPTGDQSATGGPRLRIPPEIAEEYLVTRVEPEYPEQARKHRIQGPVILDAWVGKDGTVQKLAAISGNPELVQAATQAVHQWHFRPFFHEGQPQEFASRITVVFRLP
jgi:TonB family protein